MGEKSIKSPKAISYCRKHMCFCFFGCSVGLILYQIFIRMSGGHKTLYFYVTCRLEGQQSEELCVTEVLKVLLDAAGRGPRFQA